ncbi:MAG TPA: TolC family protein [Bryobacteraceae bacterium]|nr:TolC family protein [Bryobacteraceae bacterium]
MSRIHCTLFSRCTLTPCRLFHQSFSCAIFFLYLVTTGAAFAQVQQAGQPGTPAASTPITVEAAVSEAVQHNLALLAERYNVSIAQAKILTASLRPNPVLTLDADHLPWAGTHYNNDNMAGPAEYSVRTDFLFERAGKRSGRIAVAQEEKSIAELSLLDTIRSLVFDVENAFVETLLAQANLKLARENSAALESVVKINTDRLRAGDLARVELTRVQLAKLQFDNQVRQADLRLETAQRKLQLLLGRAGDAALVQVAGDLSRAPITTTLDELQKTAQTKRPDLLAGQQMQARSLADVRLQLAQGKVDYTLGSEYRRQQGLAGRGNSLGFFVQTNIPIFNRNQGEIARANQERIQTEARQRALVAAITNEVQIAYQQYTVSRDSLSEIQHQMLGRALDVRDTTEYSYKRGEASLVEFLDAQRAYNDTIQTYNEAQADFARSLYSIQSATGENVTQ